MTVSLDDLWDWDDPGASERVFRSAAAESDTPLGRLLALTRVARALGLQDRYEEGHGLLDHLLEELARGSGAEDVVAAEVAARVALERGRLLRSAGDPDAALPYFEEAAVAAGAAGLTALRLDALHMTALVGTPDEQLARGRRALEEARASTAPEAPRWEASLLNNLGMAHHERGDLSAALETFEQAVAVRRALGEARSVQIAEWMVAWTLRLLGRVEEARVIQLRLREELMSAGIDDVYVAEELALLEGSAGPERR